MSHLLMLKKNTANLILLCLPETIAASIHCYCAIGIQGLRGIWGLRAAATRRRSLCFFIKKHKCLH